MTGPRWLLLVTAVWLLVASRFYYCAKTNPAPPRPLLAAPDAEVFHSADWSCLEQATLARRHSLIGVCKSASERALVLFEPALGERIALGRLENAAEVLALASTETDVFAAVRDTSEQVAVHQWRDGALTRLEPTISDPPGRLLTLTSVAGRPTLIFRRGTVTPEVNQYTWTGSAWLKTELNPFDCPTGTMCSTHGAYFGPDGWHFLLVAAPGKAWTGEKGPRGRAKVHWVRAGGGPVKLGEAELTQDEFTGPGLMPWVGGVVTPSVGRIFELIGSTVVEVDPLPDTPPALDLVETGDPIGWAWSRARTRRAWSGLAASLVEERNDEHAITLALAGGDPVVIAPTGTSSSGTGLMRLVPAGPAQGFPTLAWWAVWPSGHAVALSADFQRLDAPAFRARVQLALTPMGDPQARLLARFGAASGPLLLFAFPLLFALAGLTWLWQRYGKKNREARLSGGRLLIEYGALVLLFSWPYWHQTAAF